MPIRRARPSDLNQILQLVSSKTYNPYPLRDVSGEQVKAHRLRGYTTDWEQLCGLAHVALLVAEEDGQIQAFVMAVYGSQESITGESLGVLYEVTSGPQVLPVLQDLLLEAEVVGREHGAETMVWEILYGEAEEEKYYRDLGYYVDLNRILKRVNPQPAFGRSSRAFPVRLAELSDRLFVLYLNTECSHHTIPAGRSIDKELVERSYMEVYETLDMVGGPDLTTFIAVDPEEHRPAGYLMLKTGYQERLSGHRYGYIYDLAVEPDYWGRPVVHSLMARAEIHLSQLDPPIHYISAEISETNVRALKTAIKAFSYTLESRRWVKPLNSPADPENTTSFKESN